MTTTQVMAAAAVMLGVTGVALLAARRLHVGSIVALLFVGVALGPHSPFALVHAPAEEFQAVGEIGVILLLFVLALGIQPARLWASRRTVAGAGAAQYFAATAACTAIVLWLTPAASNTALIVGLGCAMSSSAIALPLIIAHGDAQRPRGRLAIAIDIFQGFMVAPVLMIVPALAGRAASGGRWTVLLHVLVALAVLFLLVRVVMPVLLRRAARALGSGAFSMIVLSGVLFASWVMDWAGASAAMGAFLMGLMLSRSVFAAQIRAVTDPAKQLLLALFFISIGMAIDPAGLFAMKGALAVFLPAIFAAKVATVYAVARAWKLPPPDALMAALLLMPLDEIAYVIFAGAHDAGLLDAGDYALSLSVLSLSFVVSPLLINLGYRLTARTAHGPADRAGPATTQPGPVIVVGCGALGEIVCSVLERASIAYACYDDDIDRVATARVRGHAVTYGRLEEPAALPSFGIPDARLLVVAPEAHAYAKHVIALVREFQPKVPIVSASGSLAERDELRALGVTGYALLAPGALRLGEELLRTLGVEAIRARDIIAALGQDDYALLRRPLALSAPVEPASAA
jgi:glutathione-regulated potassium-efflux system ancillary protein KefC